MKFSTLGLLIIMFFCLCNPLSQESMVAISMKDSVDHWDYTMILANDQEIARITITNPDTVLSVQQGIRLKAIPIIYPNKKGVQEDLVIENDTVWQILYFK